MVAEGLKLDATDKGGRTARLRAASSFTSAVCPFLAARMSAVLPSRTAVSRLPPFCQQQLHSSSVSEAGSQRECSGESCGLIHGGTR